MDNQLHIVLAGKCHWTGSLVQVLQGILVTLLMHQTEKANAWQMSVSIVIFI